MVFNMDNVRKAITVPDEIMVDMVENSAHLMTAWNGSQWVDLWEWKKGIVIVSEAHPAVVEALGRAEIVLGGHE